MKKNTVVQKAKVRAALYAVLFAGGVYIDVQVMFMGALVGAFFLFTLIDVGRWYQASK